MVAVSNDIQEALKPFFQRASEAEERLARLEISTRSTKDTGNEELSKKVTELQSQLENEKAERALEREKYLKEAKQRDDEIAKHKYRIVHLLRTIDEYKSKLASK